MVDKSGPAKWCVAVEKIRDTVLAARRELLAVLDPKREGAQPGVRVVNSKALNEDVRFVSYKLVSYK